MSMSAFIPNAYYPAWDTKRSRRFLTLENWNGNHIHIV